MRVNLLDMYTPHELRIMTCKDIANKREKKEKEIDAYLKTRNLDSRRKWNVRFGGYRW